MQQTNQLDRRRPPGGHPNNNVRHIAELMPTRQARSIYRAIALAATVLIAGSASAQSTIPVEIFNPDYLEGDSNYHSLTVASDGMVYFTVNSHHPYSSVRMYRFDPGDESVEMLGDITAVLGEDPAKQIPHGKIHTPLFEYDGFLYFATHTSQYDGNLPDMTPADGRAPYHGGHFMRFDISASSFEELAHLGIPNEGIITMAVDTVSQTLYGLTWPSGILISYNLDEGRLHNWGAVQGRGEWGQLPEEWDFICRRLGVDPDGNIYGSTDTGRIWRFGRGVQRPVTYLDPLTLDHVPPVQDAAFVWEPEPHYFWRNWRTILWNPNTDSFWGLHGGSTQLFEFRPADGVLRSVASLRVVDGGADNTGFIGQDDAGESDHTGMNRPGGAGMTRRNPFRSQLGFALGPNNTLYYLAHGPPIEVPSGRAAQTSVHLMTYEIDAGKVADHGVLMGPNNRRVFFTESLAIDADGRLYTVAWVETTDPAQMAVVQAARGLAVPEETQDVIYEIQLVRILQ